MTRVDVAVGIAASLAAVGLLGVWILVRMDAIADRDAPQPPGGVADLERLLDAHTSRLTADEYYAMLADYAAAAGPPDDRGDDFDW